jgi:hypothetical protein
MPYSDFVCDLDAIGGSRSAYSPWDRRGSPAALKRARFWASGEALRATTRSLSARRRPKPTIPSHSVMGWQVPARDPAPSSVSSHRLALRLPSSRSFGFVPRSLVSTAVHTPTRLHACLHSTLHWFAVIVSSALTFYYFSTRFLHSRPCPLTLSTRSSCSSLVSRT